MKLRYYLFQIFIILILLGAISIIYWLLNDYRSQEMFDYSKDNSGVFITADGLITTSTFAFVGFASLSPSSSGSSVSIRRLDWKGLWSVRYSFLLGLSVVLTVISAFAIWWNPPYMLASVVISSIILIFVIAKYTWFNINAEKQAAKKFLTLIKYLKVRKSNFGSDKKYEQIIKTVLRPIINPLKGSHNVDLIRQILSSDFVINMFLHNYKRGQIHSLINSNIKNNSNRKNSPGEYEGKINNIYHELSSIADKGIPELDKYIFKRLLLPTLYGSMKLSEKAYLSCTLAIKLNEKYHKVSVNNFILFVTGEIFYNEEKLKDLNKIAKKIFESMIK